MKFCCRQPFPKVVAYKAPRHLSSKVYMVQHKITHKCGTWHREWGLRATETEIANWRLGVRNAQELVYPSRRSSFERCIVKADNWTTRANASL